MSFRSKCFPRLLFTLLAAVVFECRADVVLLTNGDRLSGEIQRLEESSLALKTTYAGVVEIDWKMVAKLDTDRAFNIEVDTGLRLEGSFVESEEGLLVITDERQVALDPSQLIEMEPVAEESPESLWEKVDLSLDFGLNVTKGNSELRQTSAGVHGVYRSEKRQLKADLTSLFSREPHADTISRHHLALRYDRFISPAVFWYGLSAFERDERQLLNLRSTLGGGFGRKLKWTRSTHVSILGGFNYVNEKYKYEDGTQKPRTSTVEAVAGLEMEKTVAGKVKLFANVAAHPDLFTRGRYRLNMDAGVRMPLWGFLTWNLRVFDRFDSKPPTDVLRNDCGLISSFGFSF
jgi:hypothetical protein